MSDPKKGDRIRLKGKRTQKIGRIIEAGPEVSLVDIDGVKQFIPNSHFDVSVKE